MRALLHVALLTMLLLPAAPVRAQLDFDPCSMALMPADVPPELQAEPVDGSDDPLVCEYSYWVARAGPSRLTAIRSLVIISPSVQQAAADFDEYRTLLIAAGWEEGQVQPIGDEARVFRGSDPDSGIYTVQQLVRRSSVLVLTEATGPAMADNPSLVLDLARIVDDRVVLEFAAGYANPVRSGSIWPRVAVPTVVGEARLSASPLGNPNLQLGALSGLVSLDRQGTRFVALTDRGPDADVISGSHRLLGLPLPAFAPSLVKLEVRNGQLVVTERLGLRLASGLTNPRTGTPFATGLPTSDAYPAAYDSLGRQRWGTDPYGLDPEGLAVDPRDGSFWVAEEYGPSLVQVAANGTIQLRLVPAGTALAGPGQNLRPILPPELARRKPDRGFEGVAISPDGNRLFAVLQSPLPIPDQATGEGSRVVRLLTLDLSGPEPVVDGVYLYLLEPYGTVGAPKQDDVQVTDLVAVSDSRLLATERAGVSTTVYALELEEASNVLGRSTVDGRTLEQLDENWLAANAIWPVSKHPVLGLSDVGLGPASYEGLTLIDESTLALVNDNNFGLAGFDPSGQPISNHEATTLSIVHLPVSLRGDELGALSAVQDDAAARAPSP